MGRGAPPEASGTREQGRGRGAALGALCLLPLLLLARLGAPGARPAAGGAQDPLLPAEPAEPQRDAAGPGRRLPPVERGVALQLPRGGPVSAQRPADRLLPRQPHRLPELGAAPLLRRPHGRAGPRLLPAPRRHPLRRQRVLGSGPHALQLEERRVAHRPGARGGPRDRPRAGPDALAARPRAHAPQRHAARLDGAVAGRAVGAAPALRLPGPALRVRVVGAEGLLRRPPPAHEEALPQQLRLLLRVPLPHAGCHPTAPPDENQAGVRRQERDLPLRPEAPPQERQSVLVQGPGAPRVLLPRLPGAGRGPAEHHRQRHQRGRLLVRGAPRPPRAHLLLVARAPAELTAADKGFLSDTSVPFLGGHGRRPGQRGGPTRPRELEGARHPSFPSPQFPARVCSAELNRGRARALWEGKGCAGGAQGSARRQGRLPVRVAWARQGVGCGLSRSPKPILMDCGARGPLAPA
ncbi:matrix metalloproteinase-23 isoform X1 [Dasypus novemcinctus]|uniref:matrix metalloproteinase-23 isoform X1 n=1 Tax=Dasypus novemcinctus TaxID=9361 RepID=UPI0039C90116